MELEINNFAKHANANWQFSQIFRRIVFLSYFIISSEINKAITDWLKLKVNWNALHSHQCIGNKWKLIIYFIFCICIERKEVKEGGGMYIWKWYEMTGCPLAKLNIKMVLWAKWLLLNSQHSMLIIISFE